MDLLFRLFCAIATIGFFLTILGFMGWKVFGMPALPVGGVMLIGGFILSYLTWPAHRY